MGFGVLSSNKSVVNSGRQATDHRREGLIGRIGGAQPSLA